MAAAVVVVQDLDKTMNSGKTIGIILIAAGLVLCLAAGAWLLAAENISRGGAALGLLLVTIIVAPLVGGGVFLLVRGSREEAEDKVRHLLDRSRQLEKEVRQLKAALGWTVTRP